MPGHLFVVRGDLTKLACDAWLMPSDYELQVEPYWLQPEPEGFLDALASLRAQPDDSWTSGERRVRPVPFWPEERSRPWLVTFTGREPHEFTAIVEQFVVEVLAGGLPPKNGRDRHLIALPVISTGKGGGARFKGQVINILVRDLTALVETVEVDLVLVTHTAAALAAAQKAREEHGVIWHDLPQEQVKKARSLARLGRRQGLALFLGAGVSCSAGLPSWTGLLRQLALSIGITEDEFLEFDRLDVLDQGSVLDRRYRAAGLQINEKVAEIFERTWDHSLLHGLLACLPAREIITQNYDRLFEVAAVGAGKPVVTLPYTRGESHDRWLLKMHGCVSVPDDIVLRREDYLRYSERRSALSGIVQATLLTRQMLFVGFSLRDGNFHRAIDDVRRAVSHQNIGTALFLAPSPLTAELWSTELDILHFGPKEELAPAARRLEIFLDCMLMHCGANDGHLLDPTFSHLLNPAEKEVKEALSRLVESVSPEAKHSKAWEKVEKLLISMGWS